MHVCDLICVEVKRADVCQDVEGNELHPRRIRRDDR